LGAYYQVNQYIYSITIFYQLIAAVTITKTDAVTIRTLSPFNIRNEFEALIFTIGCSYYPEAAINQSLTGGMIVDNPNNF